MPYSVVRSTALVLRTVMSGAIVPAAVVHWYMAVPLLFREATVPITLIALIVIICDMVCFAHDVASICHLVTKAILYIKTHPIGRSGPTA